MLEHEKKFVPFQKRAPIDVVVAGCTAADIIAQTVDAIPEKGSSSIFDRYEIQLGGNAANVAVCLAKLGISVAISCKVGNDELGRFCLENMEAAKVRVTGIHFSEDLPTACSLVLIPFDGNRRILHSPGATADFGEMDVPENLLREASCLMVSGFFCLPGLDGQSLARLLARAKDRGMFTCLDCSVNHRIRDWASFIEPALPYLDIIFPSEEEASEITGKSTPKDMVSFFRGKGISVAGVKLGERGSAVGFGSEYYEVPAYQVDVVDTCGAGDSFMAGFLAALKAGHSPWKAAQFGNAAGALCIRELGATSGVRSVSEITQFQRTTKTY